MALIPDSPASTSPVPRLQVHATISTLLAHLKFRFLLITTAVHNVGFLHFSMPLWHAASHTLCLCSSALGTPVPVWPWICSVFRILVSLDPRPLLCPLSATDLLKFSWTLSHEQGQFPGKSMSVTAGPHDTGLPSQPPRRLQQENWDSRVSSSPVWAT